MSRTYRSEGKKETIQQARGNMRTCEMCDELYPADEMYPVHSVTGYKIGVVCETCSADMAMIEGVDDAEYD